MAKGFKQAGNVGEKSEEMVGVVDNKNIITEPEKSPVTPSSSLKLGKGLNKTSSMPENEVKSYDMSSVNSTPQNKTFKSTFGQPTESNAEPQNKTFKSTFGQSSTSPTEPQNNGFKSTFEQRPEQNTETPREYYDVELPRNNKRKKGRKKAFIAIIAAVAAILILAVGLLNIPSLKPTGYIFAKTYRAISKIQSVNVTGSARLVDEDGDDESMDYEFNYNNNAFSVGVGDRDTKREDYDWYLGNIEDGKITVWEDMFEEDKFTLPFELDSSNVKNIRKSLSNVKKEYTQVNGAPVYKITGEIASSGGVTTALPMQITIAINAKTYLPEYLVADVTDLMNSVTKATEGYSIKDCSLDATFVSYNSDVNVYSTSSANNSNNINGNSTSNNILNTQKESVSNTSSNVKQGEYKWYVSNDNTQECVGKCVISNVTSDSFDVQVSHARSQGIGYYPKTAYLQKDGTYVADGDISGRNVKTNESEYTPVKFVFTILDNDRIKMDVYEAKTNKEMETNVIFYL